MSLLGSIDQHTPRSPQSRARDFLIASIASWVMMAVALAQPSPIISTVAGGGPNGVPATSAPLNVRDVAVDGAGNVYFASTLDHRIYRVDPSGLLTVIAGTGIVDSLGDGGPATQASLFFPEAIALTATGELLFFEGVLYIHDPEEPYPVVFKASRRIRRIDLGTGIVSSLPATGFGDPVDLLVGLSGALFTSEVYPFPGYYPAGKVHQVDPATNIVSHIAGSGAFGGPLGDGMTATAVSLLGYLGIAEGAGGRLLLSDPEHSRIRSVALPTGLIGTYAGTGVSGYSGDGGPALAADLVPGPIATDTAGNLYLYSDYRLRRVEAATGIISLVAGDGTPGSTGDGGPAAEARLEGGSSVTVDAGGNVYLARLNIRRLDAATGTINTIAGDPGRDFYGDGGPATQARLGGPRDVAVDKNGNLYIADKERRIRKVDADTGTISTLPVWGLGTLSGIAIHPSGHICFTQTGWFRTSGEPEGERTLSCLDPASGVQTRIAGQWYPGDAGDGGPASAALFSTPESLAIDADGDIFVADGGRIRRIDAGTGIIQTVAGDLSATQLGDGGPAIQASLMGATGVAVDADGNLFIAETGRGLVRRVDAATGIIATVAGNGTLGVSGDGGPATEASLTVRRVSLDARGNLYITGANRVRRVDAVTGIITTIAGDGSFGFSGDGGPAILAALGGEPQGLAIGANGSLYITAPEAGRIRQVSLPFGTPAIEVTANPVVLWPPSHHMVTINLTVSQIDGDPASGITLESVTSSEADDAPGEGDGRTVGDIQNADIGTLDTALRLRAERSSNGPGRSYVITYRIDDSSGRTARASAVVHVPRNKASGVDPLQLTLSQTDAGTLVQWEQVTDAIRYDVIRGSLADLTEIQEAIQLGAVECIEAGSADLTTVGNEDIAIPAPGSAFFYLVDYDNGDRWSSPGSVDASKPRVPEPGSGCRKAAS